MNSEQHPRPATQADYAPIAAVVDEWWGRPVLPALPRLFFDLFHRTSLVVDGPGGPEAFLVGILSPSHPRQAYIHFAGVAPRARGRGLGRVMYEAFFRMARVDGRNVVTAITSPANTGSIAFHDRMGFIVSGPVPGYDGPGVDRIVFTRPL
jgi:ribosomal protein S18 acetylase RimI-like enzyme